MIKFEDFLDIIGDAATEGDKHLWKCYGPNAFTLQYWNGDHDNGVSIDITFDVRSREVFEMQAWDYVNSREYRWINPAYKATIVDECAARGIDHEASVDGRKYIDLEVASDMIEKATAIFNQEEYDTRISVAIDIPDDEMLEFMTMAHEADMTFNQFVEMALRTQIDKLQHERN